MRAVFLCRHRRRYHPPCGHCARPQAPVRTRVPPHAGSSRPSSLHCAEHQSCAVSRTHTARSGFQSVHSESFFPPPLNL
nr:MAG TPA: hypothetical protein [Caudoviricetes sp.]